MHISSEQTIKSIQAKLVSNLTSDEFAVLMASDLYKKVLADYKYTTSTLNYYQSYFNCDNNLSFVVMGQNVVLLYAAIHPINKEQLSYFEFPVKIFLNEYLINHSAMIDAMNIFYDQLAAICKKDSFSEILIYANPFIDSYYYEKIEADLIEYYPIIDLTLSVESIKRNVRKRFKSYINWGEQNLDTLVYDDANITREIFDQFVDFHFRVAGRKTRPQESWDIQYEMIRNKEAYLVVAKYNNDIASANLCLHGVAEVEYGVGVNDRYLSEELNLPVSHFPLFKAALYAKEKGFTSFNFNCINIPGANDKMKSIAFFKKGFSTTLRSLIVHKIKI